MNANIIRRVSILSVLAAALAGVAAMAHAEQVQARVISTSPVTEPNGRISYQVTYEYAGHQYTTHANNPPGASIWVDVGNYGVTTPVAPQQQFAQAEIPAPQGPQGPQNWDHVVPEQGIVVSGTGAPAPGPVYAQPGPVYAQPAPVYAVPPPVYYPAPAYYAPAYAYPPIGISLGFGYYRGWRH